MEEADTPLSEFLEKDLGQTTFDKDLLGKWKNDVREWKQQLTERHHADIKMAEMALKGKALVMNFDIHSLTQLLPGGRKEALEVYKKLTDAAMDKCIGNRYPSSRFVEKLFLVILAYMERHLKTYPEVFDFQSTMQVLECACMLSMECFAENDAKRRKQESDY